MIKSIWFWLLDKFDWWIIGREKRDAIKQALDKSKYNVIHGVHDLDDK